MSFNTSLTGLNASSKELDVTSNNIANANSTGFKKSRAEFGDIYAVSAFGSNQSAVGQGASLQTVRQNHGQGNLEFTDRSLDIAISGEGYFAFSPTEKGDNLVFSRAGALGVNEDGYLVNASQQYLRRLPVNEETGDVESLSLDTSDTIKVPSGSGEPTATDEVTLDLNLSNDTDAAPPIDRGTTAFDPADDESYTYKTSAKVYDSQGNSHITDVYFTKTTNANEWEVQAGIQGSPIGDYVQGTLTFGGDGQLTSGEVALPAITTDPGTGADNFNFEVKIAGTTTQYAATNDSPFTLRSLNANGNTTGQLSGLDIGEDGLIQANYTNGDRKYLGQVALADFNNPQGLKQVGNNSWEATAASGDAQVGIAGTEGFGLIESGALESSNVDLTQELVSLITAQRNFQANAKAIETNKAVSDTIINIR